MTAVDQTARRTVLLLHQLPDGTAHVDWMIARDLGGDQPLITFRLPQRLDELKPGDSMDAERLGDHRPTYLDYEGPVSDDRGTVTRLARGEAVMQQPGEDVVDIQITWIEPPELNLRQSLRLVAQTNERWVVAAAAPGTGEHAIMEPSRPDESSPVPEPGAPPPPPPAPPVSATAPTSDEPLPVAETTAVSDGNRKITAFGKERRHEEKWARTPNTTGTGAIHVRSFHCKLTDDALAYMDQCINEWLDANPQYEVKFVTSSVGTLTGKLKEPHLICQVWV